MSFDTERMPLYRLQVWSQTSGDWLDTEHAVPDLAFLMRMADAHMSIMRGLPTITLCARCGRRICRACTKNHRVGPVESWMETDEQKPQLCANIQAGS